MNTKVVILIAEDDEGHAGLVRKNLARAGIVNELLHFKDGQEILDFLFQKGNVFRILPRRHGGTDWRRCGTPDPSGSSSTPR